MKLYYCLIFSSFFLLSCSTKPSRGPSNVPEDTSTAAGSPSKYSRKRTDCDEHYERFKCSNFQKDKWVKDYVIKCDSQEDKSTTLDHFGLCFSHGLGAWGDAITGIPTSVLSNLRRKAQPAVRLAVWQEKCRKNLECIKNLIRAGYRQKISDDLLTQKAQAVYKGWRSWRVWRGFEFYYNKAANRDGLGTNNDPWFRKQMRAIFPVKKKTSNNKSLSAIWASIKKQTRDRYQCLNSEGQTVMKCYALFTVLDPTIALTIYAKYPQIAALVGKQGSKLGKTSQSTKADELRRTDDVKPFTKDGTYHTDYDIIINLPSSIL